MIYIVGRGKDYIDFREADTMYSGVSNAVPREWWRAAAGPRGVLGAGHREAGDRMRQEGE